MRQGSCNPKKSPCEAEGSHFECFDSDAAYFRRHKSRSTSASKRLRNLVTSLRIELDKGVLIVILGIETREAVSPAFPGFWPGRWSSEGVAGNVNHVRGGS